MGASQRFNPQTKLFNVTGDIHPNQNSHIGSHFTKQKYRNTLLGDCLRASSVLLLLFLAVVWCSVECCVLAVLMALFLDAIGGCWGCWWASVRALFRRCAPSSRHRPESVARIPESCPGGRSEGESSPERPA